MTTRPSTAFCAGIAIQLGEEPRIDTRVLAELLDLRHQTVFETVKEYRQDFEELGKVRFETGASPESRTGQKVKFAMLNEYQSYLHLTFCRNTPHVRAQKVRLIKAFAEARRAREITGTEYLPTYHDLHDEIHRLAAGSQNERFVHMNVNKAINKAVGIRSGERGSAPVGHRSLLVVAQMTATNAMRRAQDHHDGYRAAKDALDGLGRVLIGGAA